jgi:hypothetical protein
MEAARAQSLQRAMMTSAWIYPTRSPFGRDRWRIIESSKPDRIAVAADRGLWSCTHEQHRLGPSSGSRDGSEHVDAVFKLDRIHNLLIRR